MSNKKILIGIVLLVLSTWALSTQEASGKWLMQMSLPLFWAVLFRYSIHLLWVSVTILRVQGLVALRSSNYGLQIIRGVVTFVITLVIFTALSYLPQAEATAIYFLAPLIVLCVAPWFLGERSRLHRWIAAFVGFSGVLVIVRPGAGLNAIGVAYAFLAAVLLASQFVFTRKLAHDDSKTTLLWTGIVGVVGGIVLVPLQWHAGLVALSGFKLWQWLLILNTGFFGTLGHVFQIKAYQIAPASLLAPFSYLQIVAAAALGLAIWGQFPDVWDWFGILIVCGSGTVVTIIEWCYNQRSNIVAGRVLEAKKHNNY